MAALETDIKALDRIRTRLVGMKDGKSCAHSHPKSVATKPCPAGAREAKGRKTVRRAARASAKPNPLIKSPTDKARSQNIAKLRREGYPPKRAAAAAYRNQREQQKRRGLPVTRKPRGVSEAREAFTVAKRNVKATQGGRRAGVLRDGRAVHAFVAKSIAGYSEEVFLTIPVDLKGRPLSPKPYLVAKGQKDRVHVDVSDAIRPCIQTNASGAIFCHSHPSGDTMPSDSDKTLTTRLRKALKAGAPGCAFLDHVIVGAETQNFYSFADRKQGFA